MKCETSQVAEPLTVLFFTSRLGTGGAEMQLLRLLNHFDRAWIRPVLAVARSGGNYEHLLREDVEFHVLTHGRIRSATLSMMQAAPSLRRLIRQVQPAVVMGVLDPAIAALGWAVRGLSPKYRPRFVACVQNNFSAETQDRNFIARCLQPLVVSGYRSADLVIALSAGVASDLAKCIPDIANRIRVIFNAAWDEAILSRSLEPCPLQRTAELPLLVSCGRFVKQKGFSNLLQAMVLVRRERNVRLWMLGTGPEFEETRRLAARLGLEDDVVFVGFQENPFPFFRVADLFVLSSLYEGFGNVLVEAMSCGTAVLSTDCPYGPGEIIVSGETGFLVPPGDSEALADGILSALSDSERLRRVAEAGHRRAVDFSSESIARSYALEIRSLGNVT